MLIKEDIDQLEARVNKLRCDLEVAGTRLADIGNQIVDPTNSDQFRKKMIYFKKKINGLQDKIN